MDLIEIDGFNSLLVRQFARQPLANMDLLIYFRLTLAIMFDQSRNLDSIATILYRFLYLFAKIVYLLVLNMLLELVSLEITVNSWEQTTGFFEYNFIAICPLSLNLWLI